MRRTDRSWSATPAPPPSPFPCRSAAAPARAAGRGRGEIPMIEVLNLVKRYGQFLAVDDVSLDVPGGQIHGFLGPNGAGKTTSIRMIAGLLKPSGGRITIAGHDLAR